MASFSYPTIIVKDTPALASEVQGNFNAVQDFSEDETMHSDGTNPIQVPLVLPGEPTQDNHAANKGYVDNVFPVGSIVEYAPDDLPDGTTTDPDWAWADGSLQSISDPRFTDLYNKIGIRYGGDGITNFALPDKAGNFSVGRDSGDVDFDTVGKTGGHKALSLHSHTVASHNHTGPSHAHTMTHGHADNISLVGASNHTHPPSSRTHFVVQSIGGAGNGSVATALDPDYGATNVTITGSGGAHNHTVNGGVTGFTGSTVAAGTGNTGGKALTTEDAGTGDSGNLPPFLVSNYLIRL